MISNVKHDVKFPNSKYLINASLIFIIDSL
jgi:hypothetical protein